MTIREINADALVKIGSKDGKGYFYSGYLKDADFKAIDKGLYDLAKRDFSNALRLMKEKDIDDIDQKAVTKFTKAFQAYKNFVPITEREIADKFESMVEPGVVAVIVEGGGDGEKWMHEERQHFMPKNADGAAEAVGAVYRGICTELQANYMSLYRETKPFKIGRYKAVIKRQEREINLNAYGAYSDPSGIIRGTLDQAVKAICYKDGKMVVEPRIVKAVIKERME